jgi:YcxB-like protein
MNIEYEISERDYLQAQRLAIKNHPRLWVRWTRVILPVFGLLLLLGFIINIALIIAVFKRPFSLGSLPAFVIPALFISSPLLNRRSQKRLYAQSTSLHGRLSLSADLGGMEFAGPSFQSKVDWSVFQSFCEDKDSIVLFQRTLVINIIPKRELNADNIQDLRKILQSRIQSS